MLAWLVAREAVDDEAAEPAAGEEGADRRGRDDLEDRDPEAADDDGERQRELDGGQDLALAHPHPPSGLDEVAVDLADAGVGADEDGRDRQQDHRHEDRA